MFWRKNVEPMPKDLDFIFYNRALNDEELARLGRKPTKEELLAVWETVVHGGKNVRKFERYEYRIMGKCPPGVMTVKEAMLAIFLGVLIGLFAPAGVPFLLWAFSRRK